MIKFKSIKAQMGLDQPYSLKEDVSAIDSVVRALKAFKYTHLTKMSNYKINKIGYVSMIKNKAVIEILDIIRSDPAKYGF